MCQNLGSTSSITFPIQVPINARNNSVMITERVVTSIRKSESRFHILDIYIFTKNEQIY
jgi:hypothetical protein